MKTKSVSKISSKNGNKSNSKSQSTSGPKNKYACGG